MWILFVLTLLGPGSVEITATVYPSANTCWKKAAQTIQYDKVYAYCEEVVQ